MAWTVGAIINSLENNNLQFIAELRKYRCNEAQQCSKHVRRCNCMIYMLSEVACVKRGGFFFKFI